MAKHEIIVEIHPGGIIKSEVKGILGPGCEDVSKFLDDLGKIVEHKKTKDYGKTKKALIVKKVEA